MPKMSKSQYYYLKSLPGLITELESEDAMLKTGHLNEKMVKQLMALCNLYTKHTEDEITFMMRVSTHYMLGVYRRLLRDLQMLFPVQQRVSNHDDISVIKSSVDIVDYIGKYVVLKQHGKIFTGLCPFHNEKSPSFTVYPNNQKWHCFGSCNTSGDVIDFIRKINNTDVAGAIRIIKG